MRYGEFTYLVDEPPSTFLIDISILFGLIVLTGLFVLVQYALYSVRPERLEDPQIQKKLGVEPALKLLRIADTAVASTQLAALLATLLTGWWSAHLLRSGVDFFLELFFESSDAVFLQFLCYFTLLGVLLVVYTVIGNLVAKSLAVHAPERVLRIGSGLVYVVVQVMRPLVVITRWIGGLFLRAIKVPLFIESERAHSSSELEELITHSTESGYLEKEEEEMLKGVFSFSDTVAREVMTPRTDLITISMSAAYSDVLSTIAESGFSRFPVVGESTDDIMGILLVRDLIQFLIANQKDVSEFDVSKIMREAYFIPGGKPIDDLLSEFKRRKVHMAVVVDEHGGVDGVVSLEDLLEEIVGDIFDESDTEEHEVQVRKSGELVVDGGVLVSSLNHDYDLRIPEGDYDTIAGFILTTLGRVPEEGEAILLGRGGVLSPNGSSGGEQVSHGEESREESPKTPSAVITVEKVEGHHIDCVRLEQLSGSRNSESSSSGTAS